MPPRRWHESTDIKMAALLSRTAGSAILVALAMGAISERAQQPLSPSAEQAAVQHVSPPASRQPLQFSTYLGGSGLDGASAIAIGNNGAVYVAGHTSSSDFPVRNEVMGYQGGLAGLDAFVASYNASGDSLLFSTYVGGSQGDEVVTDIAVDTDGRAVIVGGTSASDFPVARHIHGFRGGGLYDLDAFVVAVESDARKIGFASFLGGSGDETATGIAMSGGDVYVTGTTTSIDFPTTAGSFQAARIHDDSLRTDAFVAKLAASAGGYTLEWATYLGGSGDDLPSDILVDGTGGVWVVGTTESDDFPVAAAAQSPLHSDFNGPYRDGEGDAFIVRLSPDGASLDVAGYLGGSQDDHATGIAVDGQDRVLMTGWTQSRTFPTTPGAYQSMPVGIRDRFVLRLSEEAGTWALDYATRFGSESGFAMGRAGIVVDATGSVWIGGAESGSYLQTVGALQPSAGGGEADGFLARIDDDGAAVGYASYLGGTATDAVMGLTLREGKLCATGSTASHDFPVASAVQSIFDGPPATGLLTTSAFVTCFDTSLIRTSNDAQLSEDAPLVVLHASYPNPANRETTFRLVLSAPAHVTLRVYDILGRHQATVLDGELASGTHDLTWDTSALAAGTYFYVAESPRGRSVRNMVVIR